MTKETYNKWLEKMVKTHYPTLGVDLTAIAFRQPKSVITDIAEKLNL